MGDEGMERRLLVQPTDQIEAKDRTDWITFRFGASVVTSVDRTAKVDLAKLVKVVNGEEI
jgi:hypothetical protein